MIPNLNYNTPKSLLDFQIKFLWTYLKANKGLEDTTLSNLNFHKRPIMKSVLVLIINQKINNIRLKTYIYYWKQI